MGLTKKQIYNLVEDLNRSKPSIAKAESYPINTFQRGFAFGELNGWCNVRDMLAGFVVANSKMTVMEFIDLCGYE